MINDFIKNTDWRYLFGDKIFQKGREYLTEGRVRDAKIIDQSSEKIRLNAQVLGSKPYAIDLIFSLSTKNQILFDGSCTCPMHYYCKHIAAGILNYIEYFLSKHKGNREIPYELRYWLERQAQQTEKAPEQDRSYGLYYRLRLIKHLETKLTIEPLLYRHLKAGGLGGQKSFNEASVSFQRHLDDHDRLFYAHLKTGQTLTGIRDSAPPFKLNSSYDENILQQILQTNKCFWEDEKTTHMRFSEPLSAEFKWKELDGSRKLEIVNPNENLVFFNIDKLWYFNSHTNEIGLVKHDFTKSELNTLLSMPKIRYEDTDLIQEFLNRSQLSHKVETLKQYKTVVIENIKPVAHLYLAHTKYRRMFGHAYQTFIDINVMQIDFDYQGVRVPLDYKEKKFSQRVGETIHQVNRNFDAEKNHLAILGQLGLIPMTNAIKLFHSHLNPNACFYLSKEVDNEPLYIADFILPELMKAGWVIDYDPEYPFRVKNHQDEWYSSIEPSAEHDWFDLELGIEIDGQKINLTPILHEILQKFQLKDLDEEKLIYLPVGDNQFILVSSSRLKPMVSTLFELGQTGKLNGDKISFSKYQARIMLELEQASNASMLRWFGADKILQLARNIENFSGIENVSPPMDFKATLRPYQQEGLNWLQFLSQYELGGVLADDMGLGKTIQTLAHICVEKETKGLQNPCLVIAPTSLMFNWQMEAEKFAPQLKVLCLYGHQRHALYDKLSDYDLILTTYPLIVRDKEVLLSQEFHLLILDEAQCIKNSKALTTQVAIQLKAKHRLCLTGTPMENHLGELWSLFHFLMPGLLSDVKNFNKHFRHPIEKNGDTQRKERLQKLIKPFMIRRTKALVAPELPEKIEMVRYIELSGEQRDLYETIRVAMDEKIQQQIANMGYARSQIVILDALLKLRQVCCHPQLVKTKTTKKSIDSAKLKELMDLLQTLIEEGRKVLIFSAFTEMLALIEAALNEASYPYLKLTGQTKNRANVVSEFQQGEIPIFLISLKAGGVGLNLTAADTVIHFDPWWNPAAENQANDRAYRIGQDKTVMVYKLVAKNTIEEKILLMQERKTALVGNLLENKEGSALSISEEEMRDLFKSFAE